MHKCFVKCSKHKEDDFDVQSRPMKFAFFDFETRSLEEHHTVNKVVVLLVCEQCKDHIEDYNVQRCTGSCGRQRLKIFDTIEEFMDWLLEPKTMDWTEYTFIAHNLKGYDSYPIESLKRNITPSNCVNQGTKLITMTSKY